MASRRRPKIQSMTGFGRAAQHTRDGAVTVELRSTNHRFLELEPRLPERFSPLGRRLSDACRKHFRRGRIEMFVAVKAKPHDSRRVTFDEDLLRHYHEALVKLKARFALKGPVTIEHLLALPQAVTIIEDHSGLERLWDPISKTAASAIQELMRARQREGARLVADLRRQIHIITRHVRAITARVPAALREQRHVLRDRMRVLAGIKAARSLGQLKELAALVRDADVHEELVRIASHLDHMRQTLAHKQSVGKQMDFIAQELTREINTIGAKVQDPQAARHVIDVKGAIEKIREQVQNLE